MAIHSISIIDRRTGSFVRVVDAAARAASLDIFSPSPQS